MNDSIKGNIQLLKATLGVMNQEVSSKRVKIKCPERRCVLKED